MSATTWREGSPRALLGTLQQAGGRVLTEFGLELPGAPQLHPRVLGGRKQPPPRPRGVCAPRPAPLRHGGGPAARPQPCGRGSEGRLSRSVTRP